MSRRTTSALRIGAVTVAALAVGSVLLPGAARAGVPLPEPNFAAPVAAAPCTSDPGNSYERAQYAAEGWRRDHAGDYVRYPGACQRLHFAFGPIIVRPGQNDVLIQPITIEKPAYDGDIVRFKPDLVRADGSVPPIEQVHLHHAVWLSLTKTYGEGPFFAAGEEKTIPDLPRGYGMPILGSDQWQLLYMVHNLTAKPDVVWITYDVDYVPRAVAEGPLALKAGYPIWLDVRNGMAYPVFNAQRGFGGATTCTWPRQECARFDPWGGTIVGQGAAGNGTGADLTLPSAGAPLGQIANFQGGTLVWIGGHLHPGGVADTLEVVRGDTASRTVFVSEAKYWQRGSPVGGGKPGGPPDSWDLSMTTASLPRWAVHVAPGDVLRINATYDTSLQSTYEDMGIMIAFLVPDDAHGRPTVPGAMDPFTRGLRVDDSAGCTSGGIAHGVLCDRGIVTHAHLREASDFGGPSAEGITAANMASHTSSVAIANFGYVPGDLGTVSATGIPTVSLRSSVTFTNDDAPLDVYHTVTACQYPCQGTTGIAFPLANGGGSTARRAPVDFDSGELGFGPPIGPAKNTASWTLTIDPQSFQSGSRYTYFCRIHPGMRGVFAVE